MAPRDAPDRRPDRALADHPANLALRFFLELAALVALGSYGFETRHGAARWLLGLGIPLVAAMIWGTFRVPNNPGPAPVAIPGWLRLILELCFFAGSVALLALAGHPREATVLGGVIAVHYAISLERVWRLLGLR